MDLNNTKASLAINTFTFDLLNHKMLNNGVDNLFLSPLSIFTCLNICLLGARGSTEKAIFKTLRCDKSFETVDQLGIYMKLLISSIESSDQEGSFVTMANRALVQKSRDDPLHDAYKSKVSDIMHAVVVEVDFTKEAKQVVDSVNSWVNEKTKKMITKLLSTDDINADTVAILLNAIYFKGKWKKTFDTNLTKEVKFYNNGKESDAKNVQMMYNKKVAASVSDLTINGEQVKFVSLPYTGDYRMVILLPKSVDGINKLKTIDYSQIANNLTGHSENIELWLPKFKFDQTYDLADTLKNLGMEVAFTDRADFGNMRSERISISKVIHKAAIEVDEEGTKAAAATGVTMQLRSGLINLDKISVKVDHPFVFYIYDQANDLILFAGKVIKL